MTEKKENTTKWEAIDNMVSNLGCAAVIIACVAGFVAVVYITNKFN